MSVTERERHELYLAMEEVIGAERADTMMAMLPPVGWGDVATKQDLALLRQDLEQMENRITDRFEARLSAALHDQLRTFAIMVFTMMTLTFAAMGLFLS